MYVAALNSTGAKIYVFVSVRTVPNDNRIKYFGKKYNVIVGLYNT
jgi:hypothetical protein